MPSSTQPQPERKPAPSSGPSPPASAAAQETKRPTDSVPTATGTFTKLPMRFGRYQVEKLLGKGAMGAVYLALDTQLGRRVAIKIPKVSASGSQKLLKRLKTEAMAAAQIDHPSVCPVYDSGDIDGIAFIAMQYVEGETLKEQLQKQPKTPHEAVEIVLHLAEGLSEAHSQKIYHRDLKPDNIKLNRRGVPVIMDFGLAKLATTLRADASATQAGTTLGTPAYMSPEQANGKVDEIDHRSDIYSLGVIFYEMLTGRWPFTGSAVQVMAQKTMHEAPAPLAIKPEINPQLSAVCHKLIAKEREDRFQSAKDVIAALKRLDLGRGTPGPGSSIATAHAQASVPTELPSFEQDDGLSSLIARKKQAAKRGIAVEKLGGHARRITRPVVNWWRGQSRGMKWTSLAASILFVGLIGLWAGGVLTKVKTKAGILIVEVNEPGAEVLVDGEQADVTWADGQRKATVKVGPGEHQVEVKKDGFSVTGKKITFKEGDREIFKAKLVPADAAAKKRAPGEGHRAGEEWDYNGLNMKLVWCPAGKFEMGSPAWEAGRKDNENQTEVTLTTGFWMGMYEITQGEWKQVMGSEPWKERGYVKEGPNYAASYISWEDAQQFCRKLTERERQSGRLPTDWAYRLPTEAEWESACRAGSKARYTFGGNEAELGDYGWFYKNARFIGEEFPHEVGRKMANAWGLYDMHGNVSEWCQDVAAEKLPGGRDPVVSNGGSTRVYRGGAWNHEFAYCRSASRDWDRPSSRSHYLGFRVTLSPISGGLKSVQPNSTQVIQDRRAMLLSGTWKVEGAELIQTENSPAQIQFGDPDWQDYDFSYEVVKTGGRFGVAGQFRSRDMDNHVDFGLAYIDTITCSLGSVTQTKGRILSLKRNVPMMKDRKYRSDARSTIR